MSTTVKTLIVPIRLYYLTLFVCVLIASCVGQTDSLLYDSSILHHEEEKQKEIEAEVNKNHYDESTIMTDTMTATSSSSSSTTTTTTTTDTLSILTKNDIIIHKYDNDNNYNNSTEQRNATKTEAILQWNVARRLIQLKQKPDWELLLQHYFTNRIELDESNQWLEQQQQDKEQAHYHYDDADSNDNEKITTKRRRNNHNHNNEQQQHELRLLRSSPMTTMVPSSETTIFINDVFDEEETSASSPTCDQAFNTCFLNEVCTDCYINLVSNNVDWAGLAIGTTCDVLFEMFDYWKTPTCITLSKPDMKNLNARQALCDIFESCRTNIENDPVQTYSPQQQTINCNTLTKCEWPGIHEEFIGDGICHEKLYGCYNTPICNYDGGDCCKDTCVSRGKHIVCGITSEFHCRNANSTEYEYGTTTTTTTTADDESTTTSTTTSTSTGTSSSQQQQQQQQPTQQQMQAVSCNTQTQIKFQLTMYDSFGDGWQEGTNITIYNPDQQQIVYEGRLLDTSIGTVEFCLEMFTHTCYTVDTIGGMWGKEASWDIRKASGTSNGIIASGNVPMHCTFSFQTSFNCTNTCYLQGSGGEGEGQPSKTATNENTNDNNDYIDLDQLHGCIKEQCVAQTFACSKDIDCTICFEKEIDGSKCYTIPSFQALTDCTICKCSQTFYNSTSTTTSSSTEQICANQYTPGMILPPPAIVNNGIDTTFVKKPCTTSEIYKGGGAILEFSQCSSFNATAILLEYDNTKFDQNNFGSIDEFEACAHNYHDRQDRSALGCMQILSNAATATVIMYNDDDTIIQTIPTDDDDGTNNIAKVLPVRAITELASHLYNDGDTFCSCVQTASINTPFCPSFLNFKTLLFEALDACNALDEIDCDSLDEYVKLCQRNIQQTYPNLVPTTSSTTSLSLFNQMFQNTNICDYVMHTGCGGIGSIPRFRHGTNTVTNTLDCSIPEKADEEVEREPRSSRQSSMDFYHAFHTNCNSGHASQSLPTYGVPYDETTNTTRTNTNDDDDDDDNNNNNINDDSFAKPVPPEDATTGIVKQPYIPPEERKSSNNSKVTASSGGSTTTTANASSNNTAVVVETKSHLFRTVVFVLVGIGIVYHINKKRNSTDGFRLVQYAPVGSTSSNRRRQRFTLSDDDDDVNNDGMIGISLERTSTSTTAKAATTTTTATPTTGGFQPPTL